MHAYIHTYIQNANARTSTDSAADIHTNRIRLLGLALISLLILTL